MVEGLFNRVFLSSLFLMMPACLVGELPQHGSLFNSDQSLYREYGFCTQLLGLNTSLHDDFVDAMQWAFVRKEPLANDDVKIKTFIARLAADPGVPKVYKEIVEEFVFSSQKKQKKWLGPALIAAAVIVAAAGGAGYWYNKKGKPGDSTLNVPVDKDSFELIQAAFNKPIASLEARRKYIAVLQQRFSALQKRLGSDIDPNFAQYLQNRYDGYALVRGEPKPKPDDEIEETKTSID